MSSAGKRVTDRYQFQSNDFLTFTITPWFNNRYAMAMISKDEKRIAKYKKIKIDELVAEYPRSIFRKEGYFHTTILARQAGVCFTDPKVMFVTYPRFLSHIDPQNDVHENPLIPVDITAESLVEYSLAQETLPDAPKVYLTTIKDEPDAYAVIVLCNNLDFDVKSLVTPLTKSYHFQHVYASLYKEEDPEYPLNEADSLDGYVGGSITIEDTLLKEQRVTAKVFNVKTIKDIFATPRKAAFYNGELTYNGEANYSGFVG